MFSCITVYRNTKLVKSRDLPGTDKVSGSRMPWLRAAPRFPDSLASRLTPERSSKSSDLGARIHSVPRSSRRHGAQPESSSSSPRSASAAVTLARVAQTPRLLSRSTNSPPVQQWDSPPERQAVTASPQVDAKGLDLNAFFQGLAVIFSSKRVAHASAP